MGPLTFADYHDPDGCGLRQRNLRVTQTYDRTYLADRYQAIDDRVRVLADRRLKVLGAFVPAGGKLLDFGCGTGRLVQQAVEHGWSSWGCDLVPGDGRRVPIGEAECRRWDVVTFFDSLEHLPDPAGQVRRLNPAWVMASVPNCAHPDDWEWLSRWRHLRPGEHLWHWGRDTLDRFFAQLGYRPVMHSSFEDEFRPNPTQPEPNILTAIYRRGGPCLT